MSVASNHQTRIFAGFFVLELIFTGFFLLIPKTPVVVTAYIFALLSAVPLMLTLLELASGNRRNYITNAAFPGQTIVYMVCNLLTGIIFSALDLSGAFRINVGWFLLIQAVFLAFLVWRFLMLDAGQEQIEELGQRVAVKTISWQMIRADVENLKSYAPQNCCNDLQAVIDAVRYADPMTCDALAALDEAIRDSVLMLEVKLNNQEYDEVSMLCLKIQRQIKDRNTKMKLFK